MEDIDQVLNSDSVLLRLLEKIIYMTEEQRIILLRQLEGEIYSPEEAGEREDTRKAYKKDITFTARNQTFTGSCQDISSGGMFIQTEESFTVGQMLMLSIPFSNDSKHVKIAAEVARVTDDGIGVEFVKKMGSLDG